MTPKQKKQGEAEAISKLDNTAEELKKDYPELLNKYPFYTKNGIHIFKILDKNSCICITNGENTQIAGIELLDCCPNGWKEYPRITEKEFNKQKAIVLKKLKAL